jgi:hypothetical protein
MIDDPKLPRPLLTRFSGYVVPATHTIVMQTSGTTTLTEGGRTYIGSSRASASWCLVTEQQHATPAPAGMADALAGVASSRSRYLGRTTINGTDVDHYAIASTEFRAFEIWVDAAREVRRERIVQAHGAATITTTEDFDPLPGPVPHVAVPPHPPPCGPSTAP